jgi:hypothetical protein
VSTTLQQHFVTFYSPGTFVAETSTKPIEAWNVDDAVAMASLITERYNAKPYGFRFTTRGRGPDDLDSKEIASSPMHYIGGKVETLEEVEARNSPDEDILRFNMRCNGYKRIWTATQGWKWTQPLSDDDVVIDA